MVSCKGQKVAPAKLRLSADVYSRKVSAILRPVALCALVVLGMTPAATLVCQWACASEASAGGHHGHQSHASGAVQAADTTVAGPSVRAPEMNCHHPAIAPAVTSATVEVFAPVIRHVTPLVALGVDGVEKTRVVYATGSPPGSRSAPLSLRI